MNGRRFVSLLVTLFLLQITPSGVHAQGGKNAAQPTVEQMLKGMAESFSHKINDAYTLAARIDIKTDAGSGLADASKPTQESWCVLASPGRKVEVTRGANCDVRIVFSTTERALRWLTTGKYNPMTAILRSRASDPVMISWERPKGVESTPELREKVRIFHRTFFDPSLPQRVVLDAEHARVVHGAPAIGLYYAPGLRSAWYEIRKGTRLNAPGDRDPLHQAFIFISGEGMAKIGDKTIKVRGGESYYIPPNSDHVVWTNSKKPLVLIWLAWGEGA